MTVNKVPSGDVINRSPGLSQQQLAVLAIVQRLGKPLTIEIIRALHGPSFDRRADRAGYASDFASMSRTLTRLCRRGLLDWWETVHLYRQGKGGWWTITENGRAVLASKVCEP